MGPWRWPLLWCSQAVLICGTILAGGQHPQEKPPRPAGWSPALSSSWASTAEPGTSGDPEGSSAAMAFLQTGDAQRLAQANCSRGVVVAAAGPGPPPALRATLRAAPEALAHAANFLNMLFQTNDIREASVAEDVEWYQALVRSLAEGHPWVRRAVLALDAHPLAAKPRLMLQATKGDDEILLQDVSAAAPSLGNLSWDNEWFNALKSQRTTLLRKRVLSNDLRSMDTPKWQQGDSYVGEPGHVRWSPPFLECREGRFLPTWMVTLSSAFYGLKPDLSPEFKGVVRVDIELRDVAIDQCAPGPGWFTDTHRCDLNSTQCVPQESRGFVLGRYLCRCRPGFYRAGGAASSARAGVAGTDSGSRLACRPCRQGCATCEDDVPCLIQEDRVLRAAVLSCQACCMLAVFLSMLISYHYRRSKRIRASGVVLLETILFGSLLLYFPVFIQYFKPSIFRCIVLRWVRLLGFSIVYGTITLKLYRVLKVFLSRTAQRVSYVSSGRVLKMLGLILLLVLWFLAAWTIGMLENVDKNIPLVIRSQTARGLHFYICSHDHWDYMMVIAEMLFLLWGSFLCYATRAVPSAFHEPRYMGIALHNELMVSAAFHVVRFIMVPSLHPDWTLLLFFAHTHGTVTMTLALLFIPKFLHAGSPLREEIAAEVYEDELDMRRSGSCLNSSIASAWSEHSLDPDDIREELKKLYVQLEVHKTRRMAANNPHLPKKRSTFRRSFGRSLARRGAELPEAVTRRSSSGGERVGTPAPQRSSRARQLPAEAGGAILRDEGSWRRSAALRKTRSTEGPPREHRGDPRWELTPEWTTATASEPSDSESLDAAPLVCKSASAHNLAGPGQLLLPRAAPLQKSLSVITGAREEALLAASRARRDGWDANWYLSTSHRPPPDDGKPQSSGAAYTLLPAGSRPAEGTSQEEASPPGDAKVQKRVTYAPIKSVSVDGSHLPGRVRVTVKRTPPPPPVRYQSLGHRAKSTTGSPEPAKPPAEPPAPAGEPEGTAVATGEGDAGHTVGKGRLVSAASIPAQVCPWELVQEEILSQKQKAAEAADSGTPGDAEATTTLKPPSQKMSLWSVGFALKAFNRSRGKSILKGKKEGEGSLKERGRGGGSVAETLATSPGAAGQDLTPKSLELGGQRLGSEATACPWQGDKIPCQQNNNAGTAWEAEGWGHSGAEGQWDGLVLGPGDGEKLAGEEPSTFQEDADAGRDLVPPSEAHEVPPSVGYQEGAECPREPPAVAGSGRVQTCPWGGTEAPAAEQGKDVDAPAAIPGLIAPKEGVAGPGKGLGGDGGSIPSRDRAEMEQPHRAAAELREAELCPQAAPAGRGALLRQEAMASREDGGVPPGEESPAKALEKSGSQPEPLRVGGGQDMKRIPPRSRSAEVTLAVGGGQAEVCPGEPRADSSIKMEICPWEESEGKRRDPGRAPGKDGSDGGPQHPGEESGVEKPATKTPEMLQMSLEKAASEEGRRAAVCPWESREGERMIRAEICPWDAQGAPQEPERQEGERRRLLRSLRPTALGLLWAQESRSSLQVPAGPWGSTSSEKPPEKPAPKSSELPEVTPRSPGSTRASVCPWEAAGAERDADEVCPWERGAALHDAGKLDDGEISQVKNEISPQKVATEGTGEVALTAEQLSKNLTALPKTSSKEGGAAGSKKAEVCPWEVEDEQPARTEICPWEEPAAPLGKERLSQDTHGTSRKENKPGSKGLEEMKAKLAEMSGHRPERRGTEIPAKPTGKSLESSKAKSKTTQNMESIKDEICPWESQGTEEHPEEKHTKSPALPKTPSKKSQSEESLKAEVCPWEVESTDRAEICPWEAAAPPSAQEKSPQDKDAQPMVSRSSSGQGVLKTSGDSTSGKKEKRSKDRESICPWESLDMEQLPEIPRPRSPALPTPSSKKSQSEESLKAEVCPWEVESTDRAEICPWESLSTEETPEIPRPKSPALPKTPSKKSQSADSLKAEVCPWEAPDAEAGGKAEICPWEVAPAPSELQKAKLGPGQGPKGDKRITRQAALASPVRSPEQGSGDRESICPWERLSTEETPEIPHPRSPALPKTPSKKSQSADSLKAEVCPWEVESTDRAEICPWESLDTEGSSKRQSMKSTELLKAIAKKKSESTGSLKAEVCPWESLAMEQPPETPPAKSPALPKTPSKKSQSADSLKAEVCPWEAPESGAGGKAEICPWEVAPAPSELQKAKLGPGQGPKGDKRITRQAALASPVRSPEQGSGDRESICPWERLSTEETPEKTCAGSAALSKPPSKKSQSEESLKAEVCPWEVESTDRAEICPWEAAAPPSAQEKSPQDKDAQSMESRSSSAGQGALKTSGDSTSGKKEKRSEDRESICPWESLSTEQPPEKPPAKSPALPKTPSRKSQSGESLKAEVCPWESLDTEESSKGQSTKSTELLKAIAKKISESTGNLKAEVRPWESLGTEQPPETPPAKSPAIPKTSSKKSQSEESLKAEVCPWEVESTDRAEICPWESLGTEQPPEKPCAGSPALPKTPSKKSQSEESLKAEVCPWEAPESGAGGKAEICPWEVAAAAPERGAASGKSRLPPKEAGASKPLEKGSSERGSICSWESPSTVETPLKTATGKEPSKKSDSTESRTSDLCPWEAAEPIGPEKESSRAGRQPQGSARASLSRIRKFKAVAGASTVTLRPRGRREAEHRPLCRISPGILPPRSPSPAGVCPWETGEAPAAAGGTRKTSEVCPWEGESGDPPGDPQQGRSGGSPQDGGRAVGDAKADICPWDHE